MRSVRRAMLGLLAVTACAPGPDREADRAALLALTAEAGAAHTTGDAAAFLAAVDSGWWAAGNGRWSYREKAAALPGIAAYFATTIFDSIVEIQPPAIQFSLDGSVAWLRGEVAIWARTRDSTGAESRHDFRAAWLDVYEKRGERWILAARANTESPLP